MTWTKLIYDFLHFAETQEGYRSDDTFYSDQAVLNYLIPARATLIKGIRDYSDNMFQLLPCIELVEADQEICPKSADTGCIWLKSKKPIPNPLKVSNLSTPNYDNIDYRRLDRLNSSSRLSSANKSDYYTFVKFPDGVYIFIHTQKFFDKTFLKAIFENPIEADQFCGDQKAICEPLLLNIHTDLAYVDAIKNAAYSLLPAVKARAERDEENNDKKD